MTLRVGIGYDVHRLAPGRGLTLGGVKIPRAGVRLIGHSDADVILHAACDALLGAAGLADLGVQFPNTSARHRGRNSIEFIEEIASRLKRQGWQPVNLDCTLIAEAPKIAGYTYRMRQRMASALKLPVEAVNVKATTHERLGAFGRCEGMAAMAVALISRETGLPAQVDRRSGVSRSRKKTKPPSRP